MALDTTEKLLSVLDSDPTSTPGMPVPNAIGVPERLHLLWLYSGLYDTTADFEWPYDDLKPRHLRIEPCAFPIGGGFGLAGREPTIDSGAGYWRIVLGGFYIKTRAQVHLWRALQAEFEGRGKTVLLPFFDGKRAPWVTVGGAITATANADALKGATSFSILATSTGTLLKGMHFSVGNFGHRMTAVSGPVASVYTCTIWPKLREDVASGATVEFRRPVGRFRLERDDGMRLPLRLLKNGEASVAFVEDVPR